MISIVFNALIGESFLTKRNDGNVPRPGKILILTGDSYSAIIHDVMISAFSHNRATVGLALLMLVVLTVGYLVPLLETHSHDCDYCACGCICCPTCWSTAMSTNSLTIGEKAIACGTVRESTHAAYERIIFPIFRPPQA